MLVKILDTWIEPAHVAAVEPTEIVGVTDIRMVNGHSYRTDLSPITVVRLLAGRKSKGGRRGRSSRGKGHGLTTRA